jgi:hypothetical protein
MLDFIREGGGAPLVRYVYERKEVTPKELEKMRLESSRR